MKSNNIDHIVLFSGGLASFEAGRRVLYEFGHRRTKFWFFDTLIEDEDLYRFLSDCERVLNIKIEWFTEGRNPWQVFRDERFIGNSRVDVCSRVIKRQFLEKLLKLYYPNKNVIIYFGLEWSENHRIDIVRKAWKARGYHVGFPLEREPILFPMDFKTIINDFGIEMPKLYNLGFPHNNCGGACVKAGIKHWSLLWKTFPERYRWHEEQEQCVRKLLRKNVAILRNRRGGRTRPMTLRVLRWRLVQKDKNNGNTESFIRNLPDDWACSCFVAPQDIQNNLSMEGEKG